MRQALFVIAGLGIFLIIPGAPASAQNPYAAAYTVNASVISNFDITQRKVLLGALGASGNLDKIAVEQLTDDRLKLQAARENGVRLPPGALVQGLEEFAARRDMSGADLAAQLKNIGVTQQAIDDFLVSGLLWRTVVQGRFRARATPSDADLDAVLQISASGQQQSVLISELGMPFAELGETETRDLAKRLSIQLDGRGDFGAAVRRYSRAASAQNDGSLGWVQTSGLPTGLAGQILSLMPGEVTAPIEVPEGIIIIKLHNIRTDASRRPPDLSIAYGKLSVPLARNAGAKAEAAAQKRLREVMDRVITCRDAASLAGDFGAESGRFGPVSVGDISGNLALQLARLDPGESTIFRDSGGMSLILLCTRQIDVDPEQREALRSRLFSQRINSFGQGYLQELRRDAVIIEQ